MLLFRVGWAKPLDVDARQFRVRTGSLLALGAPFLALLALASVALLLRPLALRLVAGNAAFTASALLAATSDAATRSAVLSLLPVPPLLGINWLTATGRPQWSGAFYSSAARTVGGLLVLALLFSGWLEPVFRWAAATLHTLLGY